MGFTKTGGLFAPAPSLGLLGLGVLRKLAHIVFWASIFQKAGMLEKVFFAICEAVFFRRFLVRRILRRFLRRFLVRRFFFDVLALEKNRYSKVTQKMHRKSAEKSCGVHMALFGGGAPFHLRILAQTARHTLSIAARPRTQGEHVRVHHDIFGLKGMLAFAPRFFKNKNQQKIHLRTTCL